MGLQAPASGKLNFESRELVDLPTHRRAGLGIGYMPEDRRLVPGLSAEENMLLPAWAVDAEDAQVQLARIYETIPELTGLRARKAMQLSGGQQKLVALGRAMMAGRKLLLLDEPFEGVAPVLARRLAEVISGLRHEVGQSEQLAESPCPDLRHNEIAEQRGNIVRLIDRPSAFPRDGRNGKRQDHPRKPTPN
jgi:branched-chain amino acid transport system ATP-binding protein